MEDPVELLEPQPAPELDEAKEICDQFADELAGEERDIYELCGRQELEQQEVAERLGLSRDQVYRRFSALKQRLRRFAKRRGWGGS